MEPVPGPNVTGRHMADAAISRTGGRLLYWLALILVVVGLINAMPAIPGLQDWARGFTGVEWLAIRRFPLEYFYPAAFVTMMVIVALKHSIWREWIHRGTRHRQFGLLLDTALVVAAVSIALTYMVELQAICLIDQVTGERARLIAEALEAEKETAALFGLPEPTTVDDPNCVANTGGWIVAIVGVSVVIFLAYNVKVWGLPLVLVAILIVAYTFFTVGMWYAFGAEELNKYLITKLGGEPRLLSDGRPRVHDILTNNASGLLGRFMDIILNTIFPYLILGSLFGVSAGGQSLIKLAFRWTRNLRGGPAHAAIVSSAMFGTISGGPVVNVLSTGVLTIPMMIKRGFSKVFAGGMGGRGFVRRVDHATGHGGRGLRSGRPDGHSLFRCYHRRHHPSDRLLSLSVPLRGSFNRANRESRQSARSPRR